MNTKEILEFLNEIDADILKADGFDDAIVGLAEGWFSNNSHHEVVCYDYARCVEILVKQGMSEEEADEYLQFNTTGAFVGEYTPVFLHNLRGKEDV